MKVCQHFRDIFVYSRIGFLFRDIKKLAWERARKGIKRGEYRRVRSETRGERRGAHGVPHRCTQSADNERRCAEQCGIQATSQCRDQRNNERVSLRITGRCAASRSESLFLSAEAASLHDSRGEELRGINRTTVARIGAERDIKIETSRIEYLSISMCLLRVARNLFSTTLNESHCRRENNPQKTARQYLPPPPTLDIPHSARRGEITTLSLSRSRGNSARNFVLRPSSSGGRQSPISRSTEIQFKPLITTELSVHCLPCPPVPPPPRPPIPLYRHITSSSHPLRDRIYPVRPYLGSHPSASAGWGGGEGVREAVCIFPI